jgi:hypothetical protein
MKTIEELMYVHQITPSRISYLLQEGIELERLKLELLRITKENSVDSHLTILEGGRFRALIDQLVFG